MKERVLLLGGKEGDFHKLLQEHCLQITETLTKKISLSYHVLGLEMRNHIELGHFLFVCPRVVKYPKSMGAGDLESNIPTLL